MSSGKSSESPHVNTDLAVAERYTAAADEREQALCCPIVYDTQFLDRLPAEILEKDYGCGDPSAYVKPGETVVDLGAGGGKLCYIAAQIVGAEGRVIGVDCNQTMLALSRKYLEPMATTLGYANVEFRAGRIQDLALDLDLFHQRLKQLQVDGPQQSLEVINLMNALRQEQPMIADGSVDCVISNCVLNLVNSQDRKQLFSEIHRVLKRGGRAAISDIVCDEDVPPAMQQDGQLWSGCISGAWREDRFVDEFEAAGFYGTRIDKYQSEPWQIVNGIEFRSVTVVAYKGKDGPCLERNQAVVYKGPFAHVKDDDGHIYRRGQRVAVCDKTFRILLSGPYADLFLAVEPKQQVAMKDATEFDCTRTRVRLPRETKGSDYKETRASDEGTCGSGSDCC